MEKVLRIPWDLDDLEDGEYAPPLVLLQPQQTKRDSESESESLDSSGEEGPPELTTNATAKASDRKALPSTDFTPQLCSGGYVPDRSTIVVIGPGGGTRSNSKVYSELEQCGYNVVRVHGPPSYDEYPDGWMEGRPDLSSNSGKNLATLADDVVLPAIQRLVDDGLGPVAVVAGSRGGQVTLPRLWDCGWKGPSIVINAGCVETTVIPGAPVRLILLTCGRDYFSTKDPAYTARELRKEDSSAPVLLYHHPREKHMPKRLDGAILQRLVEICQEPFDITLLGPWPRQVALQVL